MTFKKTIINAIIFAICIIIGTSSHSFAQKKELEIIDKPAFEKILSESQINKTEIKSYPKIFNEIKKQDWKSFDKLLQNVETDTIKGHFLAEKYLSKTYKTSYKELEDWLETYSDYPQYNKIYKQAKKRGSAKSLSESLAYSHVIDPTKFGNNNTWHTANYNFLPKASRDYINKNIKQFRRFINSGKTLSARRILEDKKFIEIVPKKNYDSMCGTLASIYFMDNLDEEAIKWGEKAGRRSKDATAYWFTGLASFRMKDYNKSAELFDLLTQIKDGDEWLTSAGGYWGYRAYIRTGNVKKAQNMLEVSAKYNRTFYGILANYQIGKKVDYNWEKFSYLNDFSKDEYINIIINSPSLKRATILAKIGQKDLFEQEIRFAYKNFDDKQKEIAMFIAEQYGIHSIGINISNDLKKQNSEFLYDYVSYPIPKWEENIWTEDRSLVLAFIRQESSFSKNALSPSGARGLMQVMPNTAYHITKDKKIKKNREPLFEKDFNLEVGQRYIGELLNSKHIDGNLFYLTTAYNAGPGNLVKWKNKVNTQGDPLMFIEAIGSKQTRIYIERVMANYWIYNYQIGIESLSIEQLANGLAPTLQ